MATEMNISDKKNFWKTIKLLLSCKTPNHSKIMLIKNEAIKAVETLNSCFKEAALNLKSPKYKTLSILIQ